MKYIYIEINLLLFILEVICQKMAKSVKLITHKFMKKGVYRTQILSNLGGPLVLQEHQNENNV